jgi:hypothetical protein
MDSHAQLRRIPIWLGLVAAIATAGTGVACILPDVDIQVQVTNVNASPVRFVEGIPLDEAAACACSPNTCECPMPKQTGFPAFFNPEDPAYQFCECSDSKIDEGRLFGGELYVEDQDESDGVPSDLIYAAALLDWDPTSGDSAFDYVAYRNYVDPRQSLDLFDSSYDTGVIKRPRPYVRSITLRDIPGRFDLCNDAGRPVGPGFHTLSIIVTDRLWFQRDAQPVDTSDDGSDDAIETMPAILDGVPDIAAGATYDIQTFVFMCHAEGDPACGCVEVTEP